jgi:hypothetical protein
MSSLVSFATPGAEGDLRAVLDIPCHDHADVLITEGGPVKKVVGWILLILLVFYIGTQPGPAADIAKGIGSGIGQMFRNIGVFFANLAH